MDVKESSRTKLQDLNFACLYNIFWHLSVIDKLNFHKVCSEWIHLDSSIWQISKFAIKDLMYLEDAIEDIAFIPIRRKLDLQAFQEIMMNCGPLLKQFCIKIDDDNLKLYVFDSIAYEMNRDFNYETLMEIVIQNCHNLKRMEIQVDTECPDLSEKFHSLFCANQGLTDLKLDVRMDADLNKVIRLKDAPGPVKNVCLVYETFSCEETVDYLCELLKSRKVNLKELRCCTLESNDVLRLMRVIANYAREIQVLYLRFTYMTPDSEVYSALEELSILENLEELSINLYTTHIQDKFYSMIVSKCKKLKEVKITGHCGVTDEGLQKLMTALPNLVSLTLESPEVHSVAYSNVQYDLKCLIISDLSEDALKKIFLLNNLEELSISEYNADEVLTDNILTEIILGCQKLKKVTLECCEKITGNGINTLMTAIPNLESVVLKFLDIDSIVYSNAQSSVQRLEILDCENVTEVELKKIAVLKNLKELCIRNMSCVTDDTFVVISSACKQLTKVTLRGGENITDRAVHALVSNFSNLKYLELHSLPITSILPEDFRPLNLRRLKVCNCPQLPEDELERLITKIPELESSITWI